MAAEGLLQLRLEAGPDVPVPHQAEGRLVHPQPAEQVRKGQAHGTALLDSGGERVAVGKICLL